MNAPLATTLLAGLLTGCASMPPAKQHTLDSCEEYVARYVANTTVLGGGGLMMCAPGWSQERPILDAIDAKENAN